MEITNLVIGAVFLIAGAFALKYVIEFLEKLMWKMLTIGVISLGLIVIWKLGVMV